MRMCESMIEIQVVVIRNQIDPESKQIQVQVRWRPQGYKVVDSRVGSSMSSVLLSTTAVAVAALMSLLAN
jgi:hypothetical protein